ncbi:Selenoprotein F [Plasmodiophora brassicae]|nr:hypothetical protein PBRA_002947 [Plasmodiophora brassicae]
MLAGIVAVMVVLSSAAADQAASCHDLGFDAATLTCGTCELLRPMPDGPAMVDECMGCCTAGDDDDDDAQRYLSAIFTVCSCRFRSNPALASLVRRIPKEFPNVKIRDVQGFKMSLTVKADSGDDEDIPVESWSVDDIEGFLRRKLQSTK